MSTTTATAGDDARPDADEAARYWVQTICGFLDSRPGATDRDSEHEAGDVVVSSGNGDPGFSDRVQLAWDDAAVAALERAERIFRSDIDGGQRWDD